MLDVTLDELIKVLGNPTRTAGHQYYFQCPACAQSGGDTHCDNLLYNDRKGVLKCFACDDGAKEALRLINANRNSSTYEVLHRHTEKKPTKLWWQENAENLYIYMIEAHEEMPNYVTKWLWENYGIDQDTINECDIGFDNQPNMVSIDASIIFPMFSLKHDSQLVGFELRQMGPKKVIRHTLDAPSCLCAIWGPMNAEYLIICEGFKDCYCLLQLLKQKVGDKINKFLICTPAHGCRDIVKNIPDANLTGFKKCYLVLDNDEAGDKATEEILKQYPFFIDKRAILKGYKDVCEYWRSICYN